MSPRRAHAPVLGALVGCCLLLGGCITTTESQPPGLEDREIAKAVAVRSWLAQGPRGPALGCVVRLESRTTTRAAEGRYLYVVRNLYSQDLGLVDALGRAYRYRPHLDEPEVLGSGTVAEGAARILESDAALELIEIPLEDLGKRLDQELRRRAADRRPTPRRAGPGGA